MMEFVPMPLVNDLLLKYNLGHVLLIAFGLSILGVLPLRSRKVLSANLALFGFVFIATPSNLVPATFKYAGIALLVIAPVLFTTARS